MQNPNPDSMAAVAAAAAGELQKGADETGGDAADGTDEQREAARERKALLSALASRLAAFTPPVPGLVYAPGFVTRDEEAALLATVQAQPWDTALARRVQHYGWRYNYKTRGVDPRTDHLGPLPPWLSALARRAAEAGLVPAAAKFTQVIVNEYLPGQGIAAHIDQPAAFGDTIFAISLGSPVDMDFVQAGGSGMKKRAVTLTLARRSVVCFRDEARYKWTHGIRARRSDPDPKDPKRRRPRGTRVSITFRSVLASK